jgi:hypothetical protein
MRPLVPLHPWNELIRRGQPGFWLAGVGGGEGGIVGTGVGSTGGGGGEGGDGGAGEGGVGGEGGRVISKLKLSALSPGSRIIVTSVGIPNTICDVVYDPESSVTLD